MKTPLSLIALATLLVGGYQVTSAPAEAPAAAPPTTLIALNQQFTEAFQQQDLPKATACLAKNARLLVNGYPVLSSRDSLSTYWLKNSFSTTNNLKIKPLQMASDATMGYLTGYYTYDVKPTGEYPNGASARGSYMAMCRKEGASWQVTYMHIGEEAVKAK